MVTKKDIHRFRERQRVLLRASEFICLLPAPGLRGCISNYNITFPTPKILPDSFTEMPCGCATLTIGNDGRRFFVHLDGPTTRPSCVGNAANRLELLVTVEFRPAGLYALTGISQSELADRTISFAEVDAKLNKQLCEAAEQAQSVDALVTGLDTLFQQSIYTVCRPPLASALQTIVACGGNTDIKRVADGIHYSERQLNRIFRQHVGMGAKSFARLIRVNGAFRLLRKPNSSITLVSDVMGFYDLSHFARDFMSVCKITPQEYRRNMSDFYINTHKL